MLLRLIRIGPLLLAARAVGGVAIRLAVAATILLLCDLWNIRILQAAFASRRVLGIASKVFCIAENLLLPLVVQLQE